MADSDSGTHVTDISESLQDDFESRKEGTIMKNQSIITGRCSWSTIYIREPNTVVEHWFTALTNAVLKKNFVSAYKFNIISD